MQHRHSLLCGFLLVFCVAGNACAEGIPVLEVEVIGEFPHDPEAFTQGLTVNDGYLIEGTGGYGESWLGKRSLQSPELLERHNLSRRHFGEGITVFNEQIFQLTWQSNLAFSYDADTFELQETFYLEGDGWGLTNDDKHLIVSDGSASLKFLDPLSFTLDHSIEVVDDKGPVTNLNELEFIKGQIWANIWYSDFIVIIDPESGRVTARVDLSDLNPQRNSSEEVLNGIAWDNDSGRLFVTGKLWPSIYELKVAE